VLRLGAFLDDALIAASLFLFDRETMYHWVHVSDPAGKRMQASYCLLHQALTQAIARGARRVDMGSSHTPEIARPKERWGATPRPLGWYGR
jgi:lipid II:glycine glycyltransferase (peptidoglycan interpeptide bridge formation enzyme)